MSLTESVEISSLVLLGRPSLDIIEKDERCSQRVVVVEQNC